jgi:hypothetical protein
VRLYHCKVPAFGDDPVERDGLLPGDDGLLHTWPTLDAAKEWREKTMGGWANIWSFEDGGESLESPSPILYAGQLPRVMDRGVPFEDLTLEDKAH